MNFQRLQKIEAYEQYLDIAFSRAKKRIEKLRQEKPKLRTADAHFKHAQYLEIERITEVTRFLSQELTAIQERFPQLDDLPEFYTALARITLRYDETKKALAAVCWAAQQCKTISKDAIRDAKRAHDISQLQKRRKHFYGRTSSILKQIRTSFAVIEEARKEMVLWPDIKTDICTIAIAGYPNVGKSSLLKSLTSAKPEIKPYPFTTKRLNLGYLEIEPRVYQVIDTPGAFDRDLAEMNPIEKQALLVIQHLAEKIIYVFDPSESCGYPIEKQINLLKRIQRQFDKEIIIVCSKMDMKYAEEKIAAIKHLYEAVLPLSASNKESIEAVKQRIAQRR